jgi:hypothetical protein
MLRGEQARLRHFGQAESVMDAVETLISTADHADSADRRDHH